MNQPNIHQTIKMMMGCLWAVTLLACDAQQDTSMPSSAVQPHESRMPDPNLSSAKKVITPDWGIAAELTDMGHPPVATGDIRAYEPWMGKTLPPSTHDLGIRFQPNPEMMAQIEADMVIDNFFYQHIRPMYGDLPVHSVLLKSDAGESETAPATWSGYADKTLELGKLIGQSEDAAAYVKNTEQTLKALGRQFRQKHPNIRKLVIVQFVDAANLRLYASNSFYQPALEQMGLELVSIGEGSKWGFSNLSLSDLNQVDQLNADHVIPAYRNQNHANSTSALHQDTCLIIVKPFSPLLEQELNRSILWQRMGFGQTGRHGRCLAILEPVWMYGGMASMHRFATVLLQAELRGGGAESMPTQ